MPDRIPESPPPIRRSPVDERWRIPIRHDYDRILIYGFYEAIPTQPCGCLKRSHNDQSYPFKPVNVRRRWRWFGPLGWFENGVFRLVSDHAQAKQWLVPVSGYVR